MHAAIKKHSLIGIAASPGFASGPAFRYQETHIEVPRHGVENPHAEIARLESSIDTARTQLEALKIKAETEVGTEEAAIFEAHMMFLEDPVLTQTVQSTIQEEELNAEAAWSDAIEGFAQQLAAIEDEYLSARAADIRDVGRRVLQLLLGIEQSDLTKLSIPSIVIARDLTPSDTIRLDKSLVLGFCTAEGGPTSHTAILAKALNLPAVVGIGSSLLDIPSGTEMLVDGESGEAIANPDKQALEDFKRRQLAARKEAETHLKAAGEPAITLDNHRVEVVANVGNLQDAEAALQQGAEGIGLLRTEFLYLDRTIAPDETEQLAAYKAILDIMGDLPVVARTLDVGGDKELPYLDLGKEINPFLGWRAIRMCLDKPDFFKVQLRALLRSSPEHDLRIMFPMISTPDEVRQAKALLDEAKHEVIDAGHVVADEIQVGIMVEVPSVVVLADLFAQEVDFFSIGTNDLTQYTMAVERTNERVAHLGDACHPAVLRQIQRVILAAHENDIWVGLCGELAGDPDAIPILLGLGLDEFSMAPGSIPRAKAIIRRWSFKETETLAAEVLNLDSAAAVRKYVRSCIPK